MCLVYISGRPALFTSNENRKGLIGEAGRWKEGLEGVERGETVVHWDAMYDRRIQVKQKTKPCRLYISC